MVSLCNDCGAVNPSEAGRCVRCGGALAQPAACDGGSPGAPFVGRGHEMAALRAHFEAAAAGRGNAVAIAGEAGIGKSWLARELAHHARSRGATVLWGCCFEGDWQPAYWPWIEALGEYIRTADRDTLREALAPGIAAPLLRMLPDLQAVVPEVAPAPPLSLEQERTRLCDAVVRFLGHITAKTPALLVLDDLHWADPETLQLLRYLARFLGQMRLLVLCLHREREPSSAGLSTVLAALRREVEYAHVAVPGLNAGEVSEYVRKTVNPAQPRALGQAVFDSTNGNPFFMRELLRHLAEEGLLERLGAASAESLDWAQLGVPVGVREVVARRVERLSAGTARLLRLASGFGGGFTFAALQAVSEVPEDEILNALDESIAAGLICVTEGTPPLYDFAHSIVRQSIYHELNPDRRARLHRRIAVALEGLHKGAEDSHAAELASHYHASRGLPGAGKGLPYALAAAEGALAAFAPRQAVDLLRMARDLAAGVPREQMAQILARLAIAEVDSLLLEDAIRTTNEALSLGNGKLVGEIEVTFLLTRVALGLREGGAPADVWMSLVRRGRELAGERRDLTWARLVLIEDRFEPLSQGAINVGRWMGQDPEAVAIARNEGGEADYAVTLTPADWQTRAEVDEALALARTWRHPEAAMHAMDVGARYLLYHEGAFEEAIERYRELLEKARQCGSLPTQVEALLQLAVTHAALGQLAEAYRTAQEAEELRARLGVAHGLHFVANGVLALLAYYFGGDWRTIAAVASAFVANPEAGHNLMGLFAVAMAAIAHARAGQADQARRYLDALTGLFPRCSPTDFGYSTALAAAVCAAWELPAPEYAPEYRRLAAEVLKAGLGDTILGPNELWLGRAAALMGDERAAAEYISRAWERAQARDHKPMCAIIAFDEALAAARAGKNDRERLAAAFETSANHFASMGMLGWASWAGTERERLAPSPRPATTAPVFPDGLTAREVEVLQLVASGLTNKEIATHLVLSLPTVERHVANIYRKIEARGRADATAYALRHRLGETK